MSDKPTRLRQILFCLLAVAVLIGGTRLLGSAYHHYLTGVYPIAFADQVEAAADEFGLDPYLIYAVIHTESDFNPDALSPANAKGLMQLTDDTYRWAVKRENAGKDADPQDLFDPAVNIRYGVYVLTLLGEQFQNTDTVLAAYNAGQGRVREWLADPAYSTDGITLHTIPYPETEDYIRRVNETCDRYRRLYDKQ